ncbi:hypothetical protein WJX75_001179 [Coccomyxa subellipsoidea]|uniref:Cation/H+ exchanger domain-containing protein n=1 Tax=Coccomyxa subellipsoidea TaxID=248742 RepID=A0ABR2YTW3_9CHLO
MNSNNEWTAPRENFLGLTGLVAANLAGYAALYLAIGGPFAPGGALWGLCLLWVTSHVAGYITAKCRLPPLLGMVLMGLLLRNTGALTAEGVPLELSGKVRWACISLMLLRVGLLIKPRAVRARALMVLRLGALPCIKTATIYSAVLGALFGMPPLLALACGFLLSPACALSMSTDLQSLQQSENSRPSMTAEVLIAAAGASIALSTLFASLFGLLAFPHGPRALIWLHVPVSLLTGCAAGAAAAALCSLHLFWRTPWQQTVMALLVAQTLAFLGFRYEYFGAPMLALLVMGCALSSFWDLNHPRMLTLPEPVRARASDEVGQRLDIIWALAAEPLLSGLAGASVSFSALPRMAAAKCLIAVLAGVCVKWSVSFFGLFGTKLSMRERLLVTLYSLPQASVTLAICFLPLHLTEIFVGTASESFANYRGWADELSTTAVLGSIIVTPLANLAIQILAPQLQKSLQQSAPVSQPSGLDGIDQEASGQLPPGAKAAAGSYHSDNPFVEEAPFGSNTSAPAGDTSVLILRPLKGARNDKRAVSRRPSDEESQLLSDSEAAGNPFASFLGNLFGLGRTLSRHFGSFRAAGGWPSVGAFSALKETEVELAQEQLAANNPMYAPRFQDYIATANQATPNQASAEWADWAALGTLRRMSAALAAAVAGNAPHEEYVALGQPAARSSHYALFAQLSAAAAQQEEAHLRLAPFALGYEIPSGSAITKVETAEASVEASAAGGFTFAQHSPSMDATTEISPIPFIAPSATLLRQGSSTGHVLSTGEESTAAVEIRKASRPYSASRFRERLPSMRAVKEAGNATVERISSLPKSLGRLVRHSVSGGPSSGAGMEHIPADGIEQGTVGALPESPGKRARSGSLRSLLRPLSPKSRPDTVDSGASDLRAERPRSGLLEVNLEESGGSALRNPAESRPRKAYSITSPRPTDQDDMSTVDVPSSADVWSRLADIASDEKPDQDVGMAVTAHFSSAKRSAAIQSSTDGLGGEDLDEWDFGEQLTSQKVP